MENSDVHAPQERHSAHNEVITAAELHQGRFQTLQIVAKGHWVGEDGLVIARPDDLGVSLDLRVDAADLPEYFT